MLTPTITTTILCGIGDAPPLCLCFALRSRSFSSVFCCVVVGVHQLSATEGGIVRSIKQVPAALGSKF